MAASSVADQTSPRRTVRARGEALVRRCTPVMAVSYFGPDGPTGDAWSSCCAECECCGWRGPLRGGYDAESRALDDCDRYRLRVTSARTFSLCSVAMMEAAIDA